MIQTLRILCALLAPAAACATQSAPSEQQQQQQQQQPDAAATTPRDGQDAAAYPRLRYPRDKDRVVAIVGDRPIPLIELVQHIDERHYPGFEQFLAGPDGKGSAAGARLLESNLIAQWVRQYADICALEQHAAAEGGHDAARLEPALSAALQEGFESHLAQYVERREQRGIATELDQDRVDALLADYQLRYGLQTELQGWLDHLRPLQDWSRNELANFFQDNARVFGGGVTLAHILIQHRDPGTGILLEPKARARAAARLAEVQRRLEEGADFAETARRFSDDSATAPDGGVFRGVERFDYRLPPQLCRAAWTMRDGEVSDVIETRYGWHLVKRIEHVQKKFMLFTDDALPSVRLTRQRMQQEDLLFEVRARYAVELRL